MNVATPIPSLEAARTALLAYERAESGGRSLLDPCPMLSSTDEADAIRMLDAAGAIDAVLDCDFDGNRRWRVRAVTSAGRDVARLVRDELVWALLRDELTDRPDPMSHLVQKASQAFALA